MTSHHHTRKAFTILVLILGALTALAPLSIDMYLPAFSNMAAEFGAAPEKIQLSLSAFLIGMSFGQLLYGSVSDRFGRKKPLYVGLTVFVIASIACANVQDADHLVFWRFIQAVGMCAGGVIARAMVRDLFDVVGAARVFSLLMLVMGLAPILAPLAGGYVAEYNGWRAIFWILATCGVLCFLAVLRLLPETRPNDPSVKLSRSLHIYVDILRDPAFLRFALPGGLALAGMFTYIAGAPFIFIDLFGIAPDHFGWVFGTNAIGFIVISQINARLVQRYAPERLLKTGLYAATLFGGILTLCAYFGLGIMAIWPCLFLYVAAMGFIGPNAMSCAMASQGGRAGSASALAGMMQFLFAALASAVLSTMHPHDPLPMAMIVASCGTGALIFFLLQTRAIKNTAL